MYFVCCFSIKGKSLKRAGIKDDVIRRAWKIIQERQATPPQAGMRRGKGDCPQRSLRPEWWAPVFMSYSVSTKTLQKITNLH